MKNLSPAARMFAALVLAISFTAIGIAQNREKFVISAKAGGVNSVMGQVMVTRIGQSPQLLTSHDDLTAGDIVNTGAASQVEVLLNPGSYLRVGENSQFSLANTSLDHLILRIVKGTVILEATGTDDAFQICIETNQARLNVTRSGIYRFNVNRDSTESLVRKGRVSFGDTATEVIKSGAKVFFGSGAPVIQRIRKQDEDQFDKWSKERAQTLARANHQLPARALNGYLADDRFGSRWFAEDFRGWGLWIYSPFSRCYTFLPYPYGFRSPYGFYYDLTFYAYPGFDYFPGGGCCGNPAPVIVRSPSPSGSGPGSGNPAGRPSGSIGSVPGGTSPAPRIQSQPRNESDGVGSRPTRKIIE